MLNLQKMITMTKKEKQIVVCNGDCENCDKLFWEWVNKKGLLIMNHKVISHECDKLNLEE